MSKFVENNESIYNLLPPERISYPKGPIYRSRYPGVVAPTGSTFGTQNTTIPGVQNCGGYVNLPILNHSPFKQYGSIGRVISQKQLIDPKHYVKKGEGILTSNSKVDRLQLQKNQSAVFNNRYSNSLQSVANHSLLSPSENHRFKYKELVPKHNVRPILGLKSQKNFILENSITNILSTPPIRPQKIDFLKKREYGSIPHYLTRRKEEIEKEEKALKTYLQDEAEQQNHINQVPDEDIKKLKEGLRQKWNEVNKKYQKYTYLNELDSLVKIRNKTGLEKQLMQLEKDMEKLNKRYIFINNDK